MAQLLGDGRELVDEVLDVLEVPLSSQRPRLMAILTTEGTRYEAVLGR